MRRPRSLLLVFTCLLWSSGCEYPPASPDSEAVDSGDGTCVDGLDNDSDGWSDDEDPDCLLGSETSGYGSDACNDGVDNDLDGSLDAHDAQCESAWDDDEVT